VRISLVATQIILFLTLPAAADSRPPITDQMRGEVETACRSDLRTHCGGVQPGGGRIAACLHDNRARVSASCREAFQKVRASR
jgi:hypothetical protein